MDRLARVVEHRDHAADADREELVRLGAYAVVGVAHRLGSRHASEEVILLIAGLQARGAGDDRNGGLCSYVLPEDRRALLARNADHARLDRRPLVEVRLVLNDVGAL